MMATLISTLDQFIRVTDDPEENFTSLGESFCETGKAGYEHLQKISKSLTLNE